MYGKYDYQRRPGGSPTALQQECESLVNSLSAPPPASPQVAQTAGEPARVTKIKQRLASFGAKAFPTLLGTSTTNATAILSNDLEGGYVAADVIDMETGEVLVEANHEITPTIIGKLIEAKITTFDVFFPERDDVGNVISMTLKKDGVRQQNEALLEIYRKLRPGDPPTVDTATQLFQGMFFDPRKYDFSRVGRMKFNIKLHNRADATGSGQAHPRPSGFHRHHPVPAAGLRKGIGAVHDIDHLGNRRVRAVGELLENQFRIGLVRMVRAIKEKMSVYQEMSTAMPHDLVNAKPGDGRDPRIFRVFSQLSAIR